MTSLILSCFLLTTYIDVVYQEKLSQMIILVYIIYRSCRISWGIPCFKMYILFTNIGFYPDEKIYWPKTFESMSVVSQNFVWSWPTGWQWFFYGQKAKSITSLSLNWIGENVTTLLCWLLAIKFFQKHLVCNFCRFFTACFSSWWTEQLR